MTVRVSRELTVPAPPERVWEFIADPENRAAAISVVRDWEPSADGGTVWHVALPIPIVDRTIAVETSDRERTRPERVTFDGRSTVFRVLGEHELEPIPEGTRLVLRFTVDGRVPGVETFFERRLDGEIDNLERALLASLEGEASADAEGEAAIDRATEDP